MRARSPKRWIAALGAALVVIATFVAWGTGDALPAAGRPTHTFGTDGPIPGENAWHAFPVIAGLVVVAALLSLSANVFPLGSEAQQVILGASEAGFALILTLAKWVSPPRGHSGVGQPLACAGALLLLVAAAQTQLNPRSKA